MLNNQMNLPTNMMLNQQQNRIDPSIKDSSAPSNPAAPSPQTSAQPSQLNPSSQGGSVPQQM